MTKTVKKIKDGSYKTLGKVFKKNVPWGWLVGNFVFSLCASYFYIELPDITARIGAGEIFDTGLITRFILLSLIQTFCTIIASTSHKWVGYFVERNIRRGVWKKLIRIPMAEYDKEKPTTWISRIASDTTMATSFLTGIMEGLLCIMYLVVVFLTVFGLSTSIALALLAVLPYLFIVAILPGKLKYRWAAIRQERLAGYTNYVSEKITNIRTIKACAMTKEDIDAGFAKAEEYYKAEKTLAIIEGICEPFVYLSQIIINVIVIIMAGKLVQSGQITNANMMTLYLYGSNFYSFALMTISTYYTLRISHGSTKRIGELMAQEEEKVRKEVDMPKEAGDIRFENVSFSYGREAVLKNVTFTIPKGKITAIVGPSGSGKSTVLSLIQRLYEPQAGTIAYAGIPAEAIHLDQWRKAVGTVQQNCPLLGGTIGENISYGAEHPVGEVDLVAAAAQAGIHSFVSSLPNGFDTQVGQLGDKLSGGQKQRIAVARMILKNPDILLLDEPTSSLDNENAAMVTNALEQISKGKTTVIVAHDIRSIRNAEYIIVMRDGCVEAEGAPDDIYKSSATFRTYCDLQKEGDR